MACVFLQPAAADIRNAGIKLISVAIGSAADAAYLKTLGGGLNNSVISANNYGQEALLSVVDDITRGACTDVDVSVSCSTQGAAIGSQVTLNATLENTAAFGMKPPITFDVTLTNGLTNLSVASAQGGPTATCVAKDASKANYTCTAGVLNGPELAPGTKWVYSFTSSTSLAGTAVSTVRLIPNGPDNNDANNVASCNTTVLQGEQLCVHHCSDSEGSAKASRDT